MASTKFGEKIRLGLGRRRIRCEELSKKLICYTTVLRLLVWYTYSTTPHTHLSTQQNMRILFLAGKSDRKCLYVHFLVIVGVRESNTSMAALI
jgi:hypothetical protein